MVRKVQYAANEAIKKCPSCGNNTKFALHAFQFTEDCCDVWAVCDCGFDPTENNHGNRVEDVMGDISNQAAPYIIENCWNDLID